jgi:hypothetical protein
VSWEFTQAVQEAGHRRFTDEKVFRCPVCGGIAVRTYGPVCLGTECDRHAPAEMRRANSGDGEHSDTAGLVLDE